MADEDLEKILGEEPVTTPPEEKKEPAKEPELSEEDQEMRRKEEQRSNLDKAIAEAQEQLRKTRAAAKVAKSEPLEEELPKINLEDPSAKAWDRRIQEHVAPAKQELEKEKEEVFSFTFRQYLKDHPFLATNEAKRNEFLATYERIKKSSGRTQEGVLLDLDTAFGATFHEELLSAARTQRVEAARNDMLFADPAVSRGTTAYSSQKPSKKQYSEEEKKILDRWESAGAPKVE